METNSAPKSPPDVKDPKFIKFIAELQQSSSILSFMKNKNLKSWTYLQWAQFLNAISEGKTPEELAQFVEILEVAVSSTSFGIHCLVMVFVLKSVVHLLCDAQESKQSTKEQKEQSINKLVFSTLKILSESQIASVKSFSKEDYALLEKVMSLISTILIRKPSFIGIKIMLELWKSFSTIFMIYLKQSRREDDLNIEVLQRVSEAVNFLFQETGRNIDLIQKREVLKQPIEQVDKYLRVTNFYLKIIGNLISSLKHKDFVAPNQFFDCFEKSKLRPNHLHGTEIAKLLDKYVSDVIDEIFICVYKNPQIFKLLMNFFQKNSETQSFVLFEAYLGTIISDNDGSFVTLNTSKLKEIFAACFRNEKLRFLANSYDTIITQFTALMLLEKHPYLLRFFRKNIFSDNYWIAASSADILIQLQWYQYEHIDYFYDALIEESTFWRDCYWKFSLFSSDLKQTHIVKLLRNLSELLPSSKKKEICHQIVDGSITNFSTESYKLLIAINILKIDDFGNYCKSLRQLLDQLNGINCTIDTYYKAIILMQYLEAFDQSLDDETLASLEEITEHILKSEAVKVNMFSLFINASLRLIGKYAKQNPSYNIEKFLCLIRNTENLMRIPGSIQLLQYCNEMISPKVKQQSITLLKQCNIESLDSVSLSSLPEIIEIIQSDNHKCWENHNDSPEGPQSKRKCIDIR